MFVCAEEEEEAGKRGNLWRRRLRRSGGGTTLLPWAARWKVTVGLAKAVEYLHQGTDRCIIHRDIKPSNILLSSNKNPKVETGERNLPFFHSLQFRRFQRFFIPSAIFFLRSSATSGLPRGHNALLFPSSARQSRAHSGKHSDRKIRKARRRIELSVGTRSQVSRSGVFPTR